MMGFSLTPRMDEAAPMREEWKRLITALPKHFRDIYDLHHI